MGRNTTLSAIILFILWGLSACATVDKETASLHNNLGAAYLKSGQYTSALKEFKLAEEYDPKDPVIHYYLGISYLQTHRHDKAIAEFKKAIDLRPNYSEAHNYLGTVYLAMESYDDAIEEFQAALTNELYDTPAIAFNNLGWAYYKKGEYKRAVATYKEGLKRDPNNNIPFLIHKNTGMAYLADGKINNAIHHLKEALRIAPYIAESHYWMGMSYLKKRDMKKAIQELRTTFEISPDSEFGQRARKELEKSLKIRK